MRCSIGMMTPRRAMAANTPGASLAGRPPLTTGDGFLQHFFADFDALLLG